MRWIASALIALSLVWSAPVSAVGPEIRAMSAEEVVQAPPPIPAGWEAVTGTTVTVRGRTEERAFLVRLGRTATEELLGLSEALGVPVGGHVEIYVAPDERTFRDLGGGHLPEWAVAYALPAAGVVVMRSPGDPKAWEKPYVPVLRHELTHVLLGRAFAPYRPPRWFDEGMARSFGGQFDPATVDTVALGLAADQLPTLDQISAGFPADPQRAALAYAMSAAFVSWMRTEYGDDAMRRWVRGLSEQRGMDSSLYYATGQTLDQVDKAFRAELSARHLGLAGVAQLGTGVLVGAGAIGGLLLQRRRMKARMRAMAEAEARERAMLETWTQQRRSSEDRRTTDLGPSTWVH